MKVQDQVSAIRPFLLVQTIKGQATDQDASQYKPKKGGENNLLEVCFIAAIF